MEILFYDAYKNDRLITLSKIIAFFSRGRYSHCELMFNNGDMFSMSPKTMRGRFLKKYSIDKSKYYTVDIGTFIDNEEEVVYDFCKKYAGVKYDWFGAMFSIFNTCRFENKKKFFCSEIITEALRQTRYYKWLPPGCKTSPVDLFNILTTTQKLGERYATK
jgi:hypothetical protein